MVFLSTTKAPVRLCHSEQGGTEDCAAWLVTRLVLCPSSVASNVMPDRVTGVTATLSVLYFRFVGIIVSPLSEPSLLWLSLLVHLIFAAAAAAAPAMASSWHLSLVLQQSPCSPTPSHPFLLSDSGSSSVASFTRNAASGLVQRHAAATASPGLSCFASASGPPDATVMSRRQLSMATLLVSTFGAATGAQADAEEDYKRETSDVIEQVRTTLALEKSDPSKAAAVAKLRQAGNDWVAKYRKAKKVAGKPSFSNMYSVINAISGHFVSFGATYPIPAKRKDRILDEMKDAEKALSRGR